MCLVRRAAIGILGWGTSSSTAWNEDLPEQPQRGRTKIASACRFPQPFEIESRQRRSALGQIGERAPDIAESGLFLCTRLKRTVRSRLWMRFRQTSPNSSARSTSALRRGLFFPGVNTVRSAPGRHAIPPAICMSLVKIADAGGLPMEWSGWNAPPR